MKSNTRQENFRTFKERDILNGIKLELAARGENIPAWDGTSSIKPLCPLMPASRAFLAFLWRKGDSVQIAHAFEVA